MNCEQVQRECLMEWSGEPLDMDPVVRDRHVAGCKACSEYRAFIGVVMPRISAALPAVELPAGLVSDVVRAVAAERAGRRPLAWRAPVAAVLAVAAGLCVAISLWWPVAESRVQPVDRTHHVPTLIAMFDDSQSPTVEPGQSEQSRLRELGRRLLELEGLSGAQDWDLSTTDSELQEWSAPTDLLLHNSCESSARRCV